LAPRPKFRKPSNLLPRVLSGLVLVPISLYLIYLGPPTSIILASVVILGVLIEWFLLSMKSTLSIFNKLMLIIFGTGYLTLSFYFLFMIFLLPEGWKFMYWLLFLVWSTDIGAYAGGRLLKGPKLVPSISPNKTWSGFFVGLITGVGVSYVAALWLVPGRFSLLAIILLVLIAQLGDLVESKAKRWGNIKDSSPLIPGHGGLLDRLDSLIAVGFALAVWQVFYS